MASDMNAALDELSQGARRLNDLTDLTTTAVTRVESILNDLSIGIGARVAFDQHCELCYERRLSSEPFQIFVIAFNKAKDWSELSREQKIKAIAVLPELIRLLVAETNKRIDNAEAALAEVAEILSPDRQG